MQSSRFSLEGVTLAAVLLTLQVETGCSFEIEDVKGALYGYDFMKAAPFANEARRDPGWRHLIFDADAAKAKKSPIDVLKETRCNGDANTQVLSNLREYHELQMKSIYTGYDLQVGENMGLKVTANIQGFGDVGINTTIKPLFQRMKKNTEDKKSDEYFFTKMHGKMAVVEATCSIMTVQFQPNMALPLGDSFKNTLKAMWAVAKNFKGKDSKSDKASRKAFHDFTENFGTHYSAQTTIGAKYIYKMRLTSSERGLETKYQLMKCAKLRGAKVLGIQGEKDNDECSDSTTGSKNVDGSEVSRETFIAIGSKPNKEMQEWANQKFEDPAPLSMKFRPILELMTANNLKNVDPGIDQKKFIDWMVPLWGDVCEIMLPGECNKPIPPTCGLNDDCTWEQNCVTDTPGKIFCEDREGPLHRNRSKCEEDPSCCFRNDGALYKAAKIGKNWSNQVKCFKKKLRGQCDVNSNSQIVVKEGIKKADCDKIGQCFVSKQYHDLSRNKFCFYKRQGQQCSASEEDRKACGPSNISPENCFKKGCCYDPYMIQDAEKKCFQKVKPTVCSVNPADRIECGWTGVTKAKCLNNNCCWDDKEAARSAAGNPTRQWAGVRSSPKLTICFKKTVLE